MKIIIHVLNKQELSLKMINGVD